MHAGEGKNFLDLLTKWIRSILEIKVNGKPTIISEDSRIVISLFCWYSENVAYDTKKKHKSRLIETSAH